MKLYRRFHRHLSLPFPKSILIFLIVIFGIGIFGNTPLKKNISKKIPLTFQKQLIGQYAYTGTVPGVLKASFGNDKTQGTVAIERENTKLTFSLPITNSSIVGNGQFMSPDGIQYTSPENNIEVKYSLVDLGLKEEIVLNKIPVENVFSSTLKTEGLITKISSEGIPVFFDKDNNYQYNFERPFVKDAGGAISYNVKYTILGQEEKQDDKLQTQFSEKLLAPLTTINQTGQSYILQVEVDQSWLHDPKRKLPIIIDPTVVHNTSGTFATGTINRIGDAGSGGSPLLESTYQKSNSDSSTVGLWHMDEASGNALDSSGNGITGTPTVATVTTGLLGNARSFNGASSFLSLPATNKLDLQKFSIESWVYSTNFAQNGFIFEKTTNGSVNTQYSCFFEIASGITFRTVNTASTQDSLLVTLATAGVKNSQWNHLACVYDGSTKKIYVNGIEVATKDYSQTLQTNAAGTSIIGAYGSGTAYFFNGLIDEVRISNTGRTPEEIKASATRRPSAVYTSPVLDLRRIISWNSFTWTELGVNTGDGEVLNNSANLVAKWDFNETSGTTLTNNLGSCGASCNGTLTNFLATTNQDQNPPAATGGTISYIGGYTIHTFTVNGDFTPNRAMNVEALVIGGGGGGGNTGGGGGAGGYVYNSSVAVTASPYMITVGTGGAGGSTSGAGGANGNSSIAVGITAAGGGGGSSHGGAGGGNGGSGGGGAVKPAAPASTAGTGSQGNAGGVGRVDAGWVGNNSGGGGAGAVGGAGSTVSGSGNGGIGLANSISGASVYYAGGGGGGPVNGAQTGGAGGTGGGGNSGTSGVGQPGTPNTGGGGGGGSYSAGAYYNGGLGGSGIVIIRYPDTATGWTANNRRWGAGALMFDGANDYVTIPNTAALNFDYNNNFSIDFWIKAPPIQQTTTTTTQNDVIMKYDGVDARYPYRIVILNQTHATPGKMMFCRYDGTQNPCNTSIQMNDGYYHYFAWTKNGSTLSLYQDGRLINTTTDTTTTTTTNSSALCIGTRCNGPTIYPFTGILDSTRIYSRTLTSAEILSNYNSSNVEFQTRVGNTTDPNDGTWEDWKPSTNETVISNMNSDQSNWLWDLISSFMPKTKTNDTTIKAEGAGSMKLSTGVPQTDANTVGLWHLDETGGAGAYIKDSTSNANHGTPTGTTVVDGVSGKGRNFNGVSDTISVTVGASTSLDINVAPITMDAWIKPNNVSTAQGIVARGTSGVNGYGMRLNSTGKINLGSHGGSNFDGLISLAIGQWYHVVGIINGASSAIYINGQLDQVGTVSVVSSTGNFKIGSDFDGASPIAFFNGVIDEVKVSNVVRSTEEIAEAYRMGRDHYLNRTITSTDLSGKTTLPFYVAADRPGTYLSATLGESPFANYQPDANTVGLWHLDEDKTMPTYYDYDSFEGGAGSADDWTARNNTDPDITDTTAYTGLYSLHLPAGWGRNFESGTGEPTTTPYDTNTYPYMCMAYKIPSATKNNMLILLDGAWRSITMTQGEAPTSYAKAASWNPLTIDNTWQYKCINLDSQLDTIIGTGAHTIAGVIFHDGGGQGSETGEFWIDDFIISTQPYYPQQAFSKDATDNNNILPLANTTITATGGTITNVNGYTIHTFTGNGTFTPNGTMNVEYLVVAGGGAGGGARLNAYPGSGGGAGGFRTNTGFPVVGSTPYSITVGIGGTAEGNGGDSIFSTITSTGGGHGWGSSTGNGGSGGGAIYTGTGMGTGNTPATTPSQGYNGGTPSSGNSTAYGSGGGGGAGGIGPAYVAGSAGGAGGGGLISSLNGTSTTYAGGGGGGVYTTGAGAGGAGGGGAGGNTGAVGTAGTPNTGGGGGGGGGNGNIAGGNGGSGIVIIRYPNAATMSNDRSNSIGGTSSQGRIGKARNFNGTGDHVVIADSPALDITSNVTFDAWIKLNSVTGPQTIIGKRDLSLAEYNYGFRTNGDELELYYRGGGILHVATTSNTNFVINQWYHVAVSYDSSSVKMYVNGVLQGSNCTSGTCTGAMETDDNPVGIGAAGNLNSQFFNGAIDEARISNVVRTPDEIRQAYEVGIRSHPITIDFGAKLDAGNLITSGADLGFIVDATYYGLQQKGDALYLGDKIIVRENYNGTEYIAQGTVNSITPSTGSTTVSAWDSGSTFPAAGYTVNASVFKWQREFWNITGPLDSQINTVTNLTLRLTDGDEGRTIWLDDFRSAGDYLSSPVGATTIASSISNHFFQYRTIFSSSDESVSANISSVTLDYTSNIAPNVPSLLTPADAATNQSLTPVLTTSAIDLNSDYLRYKIDVCTDFGMINCQTYNQTSSQTGWSGQDTQTSTAYLSTSTASYTLQTPLNASTTYYWRSYATDPGGSELWSATQGAPRSFVTSNPPTAPTLPYTQGQTNPTGIVTTPTFSAIHNDPDADAAVFYQIQANTAADFSGTSLWDSGTVAMTSTPNNARSPIVTYLGTSLSWETTYYWKMRFTDNKGALGAWSPIQQFTMNRYPSIPTLNIPVNTGNGVSLLPTLTTTGTDFDSDYLRYKIKICTDVGMTANCQTIDQTSSQTGWAGQNAQTSTAYNSGSAATHTLQTALIPSSTYYWRSYSIDPGGTNTWGATQAVPYSFITIDAPHAATGCVVNETSNDSSYTLRWTDNSNDENGFDIQRSVDGGSYALLVGNLPANTVTYQDVTVTSGHTYTYQIAPYFNDGGHTNGQWCTTTRLTIPQNTTPPTNSMGFN